jgi:hypothetical protein
LQTCKYRDEFGAGPKGGLAGQPPRAPETKGALARYAYKVGRSKASSLEAPLETGSKLFNETVSVQVDEEASRPPSGLFS